MNGDRMMIQNLARRVAALEDRLSPPTDVAASKPPTLREKVARAYHAVVFGWGEVSSWELLTDREREAWGEYADAALAVIADEMAKRPLTPHRTREAPTVRAGQRDADVAWLRGEQS